MNDQSQHKPSSKDTIAFSLGMLIVFGIGAWWVFQNFFSGRNADTSQSIEQEKLPEDIFERITINDLKSLVLGNNEESRAALIADTRTSAMWEDEHIIGSESIPLEKAPLRFKQISEEDKTRIHIVVSSYKDDAIRLADIMKNNGIPQSRIRILDGTYSSWKNTTGLIVSRSDPSSPVAISKVRFISSEEAKKEIDRGGQWLVLDVRDASSYATEHIQSAINIPLAEIERKRHAIPSSANIFVYGESDRQSFAAGTLLFDLGFFKTMTLSTDFADWKKKGLPVVSK